MRDGLCWFPENVVSLVRTGQFVADVDLIAGLAQVLSTLGLYALDVGHLLQHAGGSAWCALGQLVALIGLAHTRRNGNPRADDARAVNVAPGGRWAGILHNQLAGAIKQVGLRRHQEPAHGAE
jgi:hypothetical protein